MLAPMDEELAIAASQRLDSGVELLWLLSCLRILVAFLFAKETDRCV